MFFFNPKSSGGGARILEEWQWSLSAQIITWTQNIQVVKQKPIQLKTSFSWKLFRPKSKHFKIKSTRSMYTSRIEFYPKNLPGTLVNLNLYSTAITWLLKTLTYKTWMKTLDRNICFSGPVVSRNNPPVYKWGLHFIKCEK